MGLQEAINNLWTNDFVQKNPNKAYKTMYAAEYAAVGTFINGGAEPANWGTFSKLGKGLCEAEVERRKALPPVVVVPPVVVPPPTTGVLRAHFTDFYTQWGYSSSDKNGQIFMNRYRQPNLQTLVTTPTPWPSTGGAAITEITDHLGRPGFRFVANAETQDGSGNKKVEIYESNGAWPGKNPNGKAMIRGLGYTDEISFVLRFPKSGNPNGFPGPNEGVYDRRNVFWQHSQDPSELNYFGISRLGSTNRFFLSIGRHIGQNTEAFAVTLPWEVGFDQDYLFRYIINWQNNASGSFKWWVDGVQCADYTGQTWWAIPNTEFGFYSAPSLSNEIIISDIRTIQH